MSDSDTRALSIGVVVPVLNPGPALAKLIGILTRQQPRPPDTIVIVDSGSTDGSTPQVNASQVRVLHISDFTHGGSRNLGAQACGTDVVAFLTQDATPLDEHWLSQLTAPFDDPAVAAAYGRQVPRPDAAPTEAFFLQQRFPETGHRKRVETPAQPVTYEQAIFSNVNSAVRASALAAHPFSEDVIMGEDLQLAKDLLEDGQTVVYTPEAVVIHSHRYTLANLFRRYLDSAYMLHQIFPTQKGGNRGRGLRYIRREIPYILRTRPAYLPRHAAELTVKTMAVLLAAVADRLPSTWVARLSAHPTYWLKRQN